MFNFLNLFRRKQVTESQRLNNLKKKHNLFETLNEIEKHKYVNDDMAKRLYKKAYNQTSDNLIDRHFYYNNVIDYYYGLRSKEKDALYKCIKYCEEDIKIAPKVLELMENDKTFKHYDENGKLIFTPPRFPSFQRLAIIYENQEKYHKAIKICELALSLNLKDETKNGFEGRIQRIKRKIDKAINND